MLRIKSPQDVGAGLVFIAIGLVGLYFGRDLIYGSGARMGPGYFPTILSYIIVGIGLLVGARGLATEGPSIEPVPLRPITFVIISILFFGYAIDYIGLALTCVALTFIASAARENMNIKETLALGIILGAVCVGVFVYGLSQPMPAWWGR